MRGRHKDKLLLEGMFQPRVERKDVFTESHVLRLAAVKPQAC